MEKELQTPAGVNVEATTEKKSLIETKKIISIEKLGSSGAFFGQQTFKWNPWMKPYIYGTKNQLDQKGKKISLHIFDSAKTLKHLELAYKFIYSITKKGGKVLFLGTKKNAKLPIMEAAIRTNSFFAAQRWLGGTLTNFRAIEKSTAKLKYLIAIEKTDEIKKYVKKEQVKLLKEKEKLLKLIGGIKDMRKLPNVLVVVDPKLEINAVKEARKLGIKVIGILSTSDHPDNADLIIPANNDSPKSIGLIVNLLADAIAEARDEETRFAYKTDEEIVLDSFVPVRTEAEKKRYTNSRFSFDNKRKFFNKDGPRSDYKPRESTPSTGTTPPVTKE